MKFKIRIDDAIAALEKNLQEHIVELKEATAAWTGQVIQALETLRDAMDRDGLRTSNEELSALFYRRPTDNRAQYSKYLGGLRTAKNSGESIVEMDEDEYDCAFNDNWEWRAQSKILNTSYTRQH